MTIAIVPPIALVRLGLLALTLGALGRPGHAQEVAEPVPVDALLSAPTFAALARPAIAPTGDLIAYPVVDRNSPFRSGARLSADVRPWYALASDIVISTFTGDSSRNLTGGKGNSWAPSWSPDGHRLAFLSDRKEAAPTEGNRLWIWERRSGLLRQIANVRISAAPGEIAAPQWTPDGRSVIVKIQPEAMSRRQLDLGGRDTGTRSKSSVVLFRSDPSTRHPPPQAAQTNNEVWLGDLAAVNVETGDARRITRGKRICNYKVSADGRLVLWAASRGYRRPESQQTLVDVGVSDLRTGETRVLAEAVPSTIPFVLFSWSPTGEMVAYRTSGTEAQDEVRVVGVRGEGRASVRVASGPREPWRMQVPPLWDADGQHLFFVRGGVVWRSSVKTRQAARLASLPGHDLQLIDGGGGTIWSTDGGRHAPVFTFDRTTMRVGLSRMDIRSGSLTQVFEEDKSYCSFFSSAVVTPDQKYVVYAAEDPNHPPDLWRAGDTAKPRQLTRLAPALAGQPGGVAQVIEWRGLDGDTLRGALIHPSGYRRGTRFPLIVKMYPGRAFSNNLSRYGFADEPVENLQVFASRGYAVLLADSKAAAGWPMLDILKTVLPGVDRAVELGVADPNKIGVMGHSYGGYGVLALLVQSRRFKTAVVRGGFADMISTYGGLMPDGTNYGLPLLESRILGGTPWQMRERYIENSPIHYLDRLEAPVLLVHGNDDTAVQAASADQIFVSLRRLGKRVDYARYAGEDHTEGQWSLPNQIDYLTRVITWFELYLKSDAQSPIGSALPRR